MRTPSATLFVDVKSGDWQLQSHVIDKRTRFTVTTGVPIHIPATDVLTVGVRKIAEALERFGEVAEPEASSIDVLPRKERYAFNRKHKMLSVSQPTPDVVEVWLMRRKAGGHMGETKRRVRRRSVNFPTNLVRAVRTLASPSRTHK